MNLMVNSDCVWCVRWRVLVCRCADMLVYGSGAVRGAVQRRLSGPCGVPCCPGAGAGAPQVAQRICPRSLPISSTRILVVKKPAATAKLKARCSRAPPPWLEDDTP